MHGGSPAGPYLPNPMQQLGCPGPPRIPGAGLLKVLGQPVIGDFTLQADVLPHSACHLIHQHAQFGPVPDRCVTSQMGLSPQQREASANECLAKQFNSCCVMHN